MKIKYIKSIFIILIFLFIKAGYAQQIVIDNAGELKTSLEKLNVLGSVLYIAAHPDDENTNLLAYLSKGRKYRTGYLSLTRGDGGQNLIGSEKGVEIGILRTQELMQARNIDGAEQFFTRAIDFGYSKSSDETFNFWGKEEILNDVVWVIRKFKPDVIITRFPGNGSGGHGNHTASAILAKEAFDAAADPNRFSEQLKYVQPWQAKRIFWNAWRPSDSEKKELLSIDTGEYDPLFGKSFSEIAALSRSMHKSQGFGVSPVRGTHLEYFKLLDGDIPAQDIFDGINTSWERLNTKNSIQLKLNEIINSFNADNPASSIKKLLGVYDEMDKIKNNYWVDVKKKELLDIIQSCAGLWMEAIADEYSASPGDEIKISSTFVNRSDAKINLEKIEFPSVQSGEKTNSILKNNEPLLVESSIKIPADYNISQPYWLVKEHSLGLFELDDLQLTGLPENAPAMPVEVTFNFEGMKLTYSIPLIYRWNDKVDGEKYRPFEIRPPVTATVANNVAIFPDENFKSVQIKLKSNTDNVNGNISIHNIEGWKITPNEIPFSLKNKYDEKLISFEITPPKNQDNVSAKVLIKINGKEYNKGLVEINYPHIKPEVYFPKSEVNLVRLNIKKFDDNIGYIMGSGDGIPECLSNMGYKVTLLDNHQLEESDLNKFNVIIAGIRAFNINKDIKYYKPRLMEFVKNGGTFIVQYNTNRDLQVDEIGPYPFKISSDRITDENADITFINLDHQLINFPNKITEEDFKGWIQERGLYFANSWDEKYEPIFAGNDPDENILKGGMLFTRYGKGIFIYTGFAWFRELPAGIGGAYRIFANMISAGRYNAHQSN